MEDDKLDDRIYELECTLEDEEAAHAETLDMLKAAQTDRDAGWQAADVLAAALDELLYAISQWRQGGMRAEGCQLAEAGASKARAAYTAARAARGNTDAGKQVVGVHYNPKPPI